MKILTPQSLGLAYLGTPYSKYPLGISQAFIDAAKLAGLLMRTGVKIYSPIVHTHPLAIYARIDPHDHSIWLPFDEAMMKVCDAMIVAHMDGWEQSYGIAHEVKFFEAAGKPIFDCDPRTLMMTRRTPDGDAKVKAAIARIAELDQQTIGGGGVGVVSEERKSLARFVASRTPPLDYARKSQNHQGKT